MLTVKKHRVCADKPLTVCSFCLRESPPPLWHRPALRPYSSGARCPCPARAATPADRSRTQKFFSLSHLFTLSLSLTLTHVIFGIALIIAADDGRRDGCRRTFPPAITPSYPPSQFATASETLVAVRPSRSHSHPGRPLTSSCPLRRGDGGGGVGKTIKQRKSSTAKCLSAKTFPLASFALIAFLLQATLSR